MIRLLTAMLVLVPALALAQTTAPAASAPATPPADAIEPLPLAEIGRRIEETFRELQDVTPHLRRHTDLLAAQRALPGFRAEVERRAAHPALQRLDSLRAHTLADLWQEWSRIAERLRAWQGLLEALSNSLGDERQIVKRMRRLWILTRNAERDEPIPATQRTRIDALIARVEQVRDRLSLRVDEVLEAQGQLSDQGIRITGMLARIESARQRAREQRLGRDHAPLWQGGHALEGARLEAEPGRVLAEQWISLATFARRESARLGLHLTLFLVICGWLVIGRIRRGGAAPRKHHSAPLRGLRGRPIASALMLSLGAGALVYPDVPSIVMGIASLIALAALARLVPYFWPEARRPIEAWLLLCGVGVIVAYGLMPAPVRRALLLALGIGGALCSLWIARWWRSGCRPVEAWSARLHWLLMLAGVPLAVVAYFDIVGFVERASIWSEGTFAVIELALVLFVLVHMVSSLLAYGARHRRARLFRTFTARRRRATRMLSKTAVWAAIFAWGYGALVVFDVLDPLLDQSRVVLRKTYELGSIELSVGEVLSFMLVLGGTVVLVRLVHYLLAQEILPRFGLGQGTEAAISLTVSYLLVALGVVLAFGMAGVDPDQLALLGGALGVGIGFGLQNVVSNFVSGLILVAERPMKVGDVIEVGSLVGVVQRIGIRSSTVRSLDGAEVIVPNADLISGRLVNWTLTDARRRVELQVGTEYDHEPSRVQEILLSAVRTQPGVLSDPPPDVLCVGFGASSIDFTIRFWVADYPSGIRIKSALADRVYRELEAAGITFPFPQLDVHLHEKKDA